MTILQAVVLGIVQGLTEFLPVSSSGHLVIGQHLFGLREPALTFDIAVHVGTLGAVMIFFRRDLAAIFAALVRLAASVSGPRGAVRAAAARPDSRLALMIAAGSVPTAALGLGFHRHAEALFSSLPLVGTMLLVTALLLWLTRSAGRATTALHDLSVGQALWIGLVQGLAILPGVSRSGATIATGLFAGLERDAAARFSFLLSIPAVSGAALLGFRDLAGGGGGDPAVVLTGALVSFVTGYASLKLLVFVVGRGRLHWFAPYCALVGAAALLTAI